MFTLERLDSVIFWGFCVSSQVGVIPCTLDFFRMGGLQLLPVLPGPLRLAAVYAAGQEESPAPQSGRQ